MGVLILRTYCDFCLFVVLFSSPCDILMDESTVTDDQPMETEVMFDQTGSGAYLSLAELGSVLTHLASRGKGK